jgi:hypothetical protein
MHSLVRFSNIAAGGQFKTSTRPPWTYSAKQKRSIRSSFRYDLSKLRDKVSFERVPK